MQLICTSKHIEHGYANLVVEMILRLGMVQLQGQPLELWSSWAMFVIL